MEHLTILLGTSESSTPCCGRAELCAFGRQPMENGNGCKQSDEGSATPA